MKTKELSVSVTDFGGGTLLAVIHLHYEGSIKGNPGSLEHQAHRRQEVTRLKRILTKALADAS